MPLFATPSKFLSGLLLLSACLIIGCASAPNGASDSGASDPDAPPPRPWQRATLKGAVQTSIDAFGTRMVVRVWASTLNRNPASALLEAITEIKRIEALTSPTNATGELFRVNEKSWDEAVPISDELAQIFIDSDSMYRIAEGKFDITYVPYRGEKDFVEEDINKMKDWDRQPKLSAQPRKLIGNQGLLLDLNPARVRRYNRRNQINLNGMIRGYAIDRATRFLATQKLAGFAVIADGLVGAAGIALKDPNLMCIEDPKALGRCKAALVPLQANRIFYFGTSASLERRGKLFDPKSSWSYRSGGVTIAGPNAKWVQFALTYGGIADEGRLNTLFEKNRNLGLAGTYLGSNSEWLGSLRPYFEIK